MCLSYSEKSITHGQNDITENKFDKFQCSSVLIYMFRYPFLSLSFLFLSPENR